MMEFLRTWLLGITGAAILSALAEALMPEGGVKQVGKLACGLLMLSAVLAPLGGVDVTAFYIPLEYDQEQQVLREESEERMKTIIEERLNAYSMDKAKELGVAARIRVECRREEDGTILPCRVVLEPEAEQDCRILKNQLSADLGIPEELVEVREGGM